MPIWPMPMWIAGAVSLAVGYLLGSIPFGIILTRLFGAGDLRQIGSGNIGATNVLRTGRKGLAAGTLILDALKGAVAVLIGAALVPGGALLGAVGAFYGHLFPVWLRFRGGKGVATLLGICFALDWRIGAVYVICWLGGMALTRISSVGGLVAAVSSPIAAVIFGNPAMAVMLTALAISVLWKHSDNISRLVAGTEPRIGQKTE
jgi:glycerol-3-phosphate acyltransferase PlsY